MTPLTGTLGIKEYFILITINALIMIYALTCLTPLEAINYGIKFLKISLQFSCEIVISCHFIMSYEVFKVLFNFPIFTQLCFKINNFNFRQHGKGKY